MSERIAIVGASVRAAAMSAVRAGFDVVAADLFADEDLRQNATATQISDFPAGFVPWLKSLSPKPTAWMYTGALENHPDLVDELAKIAPLWGNTGNVLREVRSPWRVSDTLREVGLRVPEMRDSLIGLPRDGSWLVKTGRGASGSGVATLRHDVDAKDSFVQKRIVGIPCSAVYIATGGKSQLVGIVRQLIGEAWLHAREFQYCGAIGPWRVSAAIRTEVERVGEVLASHFCLCGIFGVDFMLDERDQVWTIEINPRYPASGEILERANDVRLVAAHADACHHGRFLQVAHPIGGVVHAKAILFARRDITVQDNLKLPSQEQASKSPWPALADLPRVGSRIETARPVLTIFAKGASADEATTNLKARVAIVERQLYVH